MLSAGGLVCDIAGALILSRGLFAVTPRDARVRVALLVMGFPLQAASALGWARRRITIGNHRFNIGPRRASLGTP